MTIFEFYDEEYNKTLDIAEDIKELAGTLVKCLNKAREKEDVRPNEMNFRRRGPRMRGGSMNMDGGYPPRMRGYVVRPEDEDLMYNERYNW